jgi:hypothetical protein
MGILGWLGEGVEVSRTVNILYFLVVTGISLGVLYLALATRRRDPNTLRIYVYSIPVWLAIEGLGLVMGWREYTDHFALTYFVVAVMEDPGWMALAYLVGSRLMERRFPQMVPAQAQPRSSGFLSGIPPEGPA